MNPATSGPANKLATTEVTSAELSELYDKYAPALYGTILRIVEKKHIADRVFTKAFIGAFREKNVDAPKLSSQFTIAINHSRKKSVDTLRAIKIFQACNGSCECIAQPK